MNLYVPDNGVLELELAWLVLNPKPATVDDNSPTNEWVAVPTYTVLMTEHLQLG